MSVLVLPATRLWVRLQGQQVAPLIFELCLQGQQVAPLVFELSARFPIFMSVLVLLWTRRLQLRYLLILQGQQVVPLIIQMKSLIIMIQIGTVLDIYCPQGSQIGYISGDYFE